MLEAYDVRFRVRSELNFLFRYSFAGALQCVCLWGETVSSVLPSDFTFRYPSVKLSQVELCCVILLCGCYHSKSKDMLWLISCSERWNLEGGTADDLAGRSMPPVPQYVGAFG